MKRLAIFLLAFGMTLPGWASNQIYRTNNVATYFDFVFYDTAGAICTDPLTVACEYDEYDDGTTPGALTSGGMTETRVGTTARVYVTLTAAMVDSDYTSVYCTSTCTNSIPRLFTINTKQREADVTYWEGELVPEATGTGIPQVDVQYLDATAQDATDLADFAAAGYDPATNKVQGVVLVDTTTTNTDMAASDPFFESGTAAGSAAASITLAETAYEDDSLINAVVLVTSGDCAGQHQIITDYVKSTDVATVQANWATEGLCAIADINGATYELYTAIGAVPDTTTAAADAILATDCSDASTTSDTLGAICTDWEDAGRLDTILDARMAEASIDTTAGAVDAVTTVTTVTDVTNLHANAATSTELAKVPKSDGTATWNSTALASIEAEATDAIEADHLDHLFAADYDPATPPGTATAWANEMVESDAGVTRYTVNALENAPSGSGASAETIADAVWNELATGHVDVGKAGQQLWTDVDAIGVEVAGLDGDAMRGTDSAATAAALTTHDNKIGTPAGVSVSADIADIPTTAELNARTLAAANYFDSANDTVANVSTTSNVTQIEGLDATDQIAAAVAAMIIEGSVSFDDVMAIIYARQVGEVTKSGDTYTVKEETGTTTRITFDVVGTTRNNITTTPP